MPSLLNNKFTLIICAFYFSFNVIKAQAIEADLEIIEKSQSEQQIQEAPPAIHLKWYNAINPLHWIYKGAIGFYQKNISVQIAANCVFETSCSRYSKVLVNEFGLLKGTIFTIERLSRCNRISLVETSALQINKEGKLVDNIENYTF